MLLKMKMLNQISPKRLWIILTVLLAVHLIIQYIFFIKIDLTDSSGLTSFTVDFISNLLTVFLFGAGFGVLSAAIPYGKKRFREKFKITFPLLTVVVLIILIITFSYSLYLKNWKSIELRPVQKFDKIKIPQDLVCTSVHIGKFESENLIIERTANKQAQTNKKTGQKKEFAVEWINDCEYVLTSMADSKEQISVKITAVNPGEYGCYVISNSSFHKYPNFVTIKRIK
jgi:uncharacterized membrane protein YsdA (DUF1294 family)